MSFDLSRLSFHPWKDFFGVVMQQGRVQLDADWNEWVAELARRIQAGTLDTVGRAVVPRTTPEGFQILATAGVLTIGPGRMYVDGLLAENHGAPALEWDVTLAELRGTAALPFFGQPYLPFNETNQPAPANLFNRPVLSGGPHLIYLDVWQRDLTYLEDPELVERAVGVDTTGRLQMVWQVRALLNVGNATCATPDGEIPGWPAIIQPSGARLTTSTGDVPGDPNPCEVPPAAGYKGTENQLYRVEIHRGGPQGTATFKWSRDNATVATGVREIQGGNRLVVESIGRDDSLGFHGGDWIEILDDWHELHGRPGLLRRIQPGDGVDAATRSILLEDALPAGLFPVDAQGRTDETRHTRIRRWDQARQVRRSDGSTFHDLDASPSSNGIPVPPPGTLLALESGILVDFSLDPSGGPYRTGDYWVFPARVTDASIDLLDHAPPRGIHHHHARLAIVTLPDSEFDCRTLWPPEVQGESCDCTVCVHVEGHNAGTATIQQAIDSIRTRGGTICLDAGIYRLREPLNLEGVRSLRIRGQGWLTVLQSTAPGPVIDIQGALGLCLENLSVLGAAAGGGVTAMINATNCADLDLSHLIVLGVSVGDGTSAAIGLSGLLLDAAVRDCTLVAQQGVVGVEARRGYLLTANLRVIDDVFVCGRRGVSLAGQCLHHGELRLADNLMLGCLEAGIVATGGAMAGAAVTIEGNVLHVTGGGVVAGTDGLRILHNEILGVGRGPVDGIVLDAGVDKSPIEHVDISGNRVLRFGGHGIAIRHLLGEAMIKSNVVDGVGGAALLMENDVSARYLCVENNHFTGLGVGFNNEAQPYGGIRLLRAERADVTANVIADVARQASQSPLRAGVLAVACGDLRVAGNRVYGMGPQSFLGRTAAVAVGVPLRQLAVHDNALSRSADAAPAPNPAPWQAILIASSVARVGDTSGVVTVPDFVVLPVGNGLLHLNAFRLALLALTAGSVSLQTNRLRGDATLAPLVEVRDVAGCLFVGNDGEMSAVATGAAAPPVGRIQCDHVSAANNRLICGPNHDVTTLELFARHFAVLGNVSSGPIRANGSLSDPWLPLNIYQA